MDIRTVYVLEHHNSYSKSNSDVVDSDNSVIDNNDTNMLNLLNQDWTYDHSCPPSAYRGRQPTCSSHHGIFALTCGWQLSMTLSLARPWLRRYQMSIFSEHIFRYVGIRLDVTLHFHVRSYAGC